MLLTEMMLAQRPGVATARGAKQWLLTLPLSDARCAHHAITSLLLEMAEAPPLPRDRLEILETIRSHAVAIDQQYSVRYASRPLPLGPAERNAFSHAQAQWRGLASAYLDCFEATLDNADLASCRALCLARAGDYFCASLKGHFRAGQSGTADLIDDLERLTDLATEYQLLEARARDSLHPRGTTSVALIRQRALLIALAGAASLGRERDALFDLAALWEGKVTCLPLAPGAQDGARPGREMASVTPPKRQRVVHLGTSAYLMDATRLSRSLARRLRKIDTGVAFDGLRLPAPVRHLPIRDLLARARRVWCDRNVAPAPAHVVRLHGANRGHGVGVSYAGIDFSAMYYMVAGDPFILNQTDDGTSRRSFDELFVFQHVSVARNDELAREAMRHFEDWEVDDGDGDALNLRRVRAGARLRVGQLMTMRLRLAGEDALVTLAEIRGLQEPVFDPHHPGAINARVQLLNGKPHAVGVRAGRGGGREGRLWSAGIRLGSLHAKESVTLILPNGWFKPDHQFDMQDAGIVYRLRLTALRRRGFDFEEIDAEIVSG